MGNVKRARSGAETPLNIFAALGSRHPKSTATRTRSPRRRLALHTAQRPEAHCRSWQEHCDCCVDTRAPRLAVETRFSSPLKHVLPPLKRILERVRATFKDSRIVRS